MEVACDHRSKFYNLKNWKEEDWKITASKAFEPVTSVIPVRCSTNWAMKPHIGSEVNLTHIPSFYPDGASDGSCKVSINARGVLLEILGGGVQPASQNPYPIYDQNLRYFLP